MYFRQVDCKYIYNLDVSSLSGQGTYRVYARINGMNLSDPATFDLRLRLIRTWALASADERRITDPPLITWSGNGET